jgi:hypothetical protein
MHGGETPVPGQSHGPVLKPRVNIVGEDALKPFLPFDQRCRHQIFAVEVKQVEQEEYEAAKPVSLAF